MSKDRYSKLAPFSLGDAVKVSMAALRFFSILDNHQSCAAIGKVAEPGAVHPLDEQEFLKYLQCKKALPEADRYHVSVRGLMTRLESAGLLTFMGLNGDALGSRRYYFMKEFTRLEQKSALWLAAALGPELLHELYWGHTHQITGKNLKQDAVAGTALAIAPNWLLTCAHVINDMTVDEIQAFSCGEHRIVETLTHPKADVGLIRLESPVPNFDGLAFREPVICETLYAYGYPKVPMARTAPLVMQRGEVTATEVTLTSGDEVFLFSAVARPGNSGGPILANSGHVLGIVTQHLEGKYLSDESSITVQEGDAPRGWQEANTKREGGHPSLVLPFYAGISTRTLAKAIADLEPSLALPIETYE